MCLPLWPVGSAALPGLFALCRLRLVCAALWQRGGRRVITGWTPEGGWCCIIQRWSAVGRVPVCGARRHQLAAAWPGRHRASAAEIAGLSGGRGAAAEGVEGDVKPVATATDATAIDATTTDSTDGACSFSADTRVATPSGERAIASLHVGDHVLAYDPTSGTTSTQTVPHVWINHDTDLLDVTLHTADGKQAVAGASDAKKRAVTLRAHGLRAPPDDQVDRAQGSTVHADETIHTTDNHPWLTTDRGWVLAGELHSGEQIVHEGGAWQAGINRLVSVS
jgi:hypothetical protein